MNIHWVTSDERRKCALCEAGRLHAALCVTDAAHIEGVEQRVSRAALAREERLMTVGAAERQ